MTILQLAKVYADTLADINAANDEAKMIRCSCGNLTASYSGMPGGGGPGDPTGRAAVKISELTDKAEKLTDYAEDIRLQLISAITKKTPENVRPILFARLVCLKSYAEIAKDYNFSEGYCRNVIHNWGGTECEVLSN